MLEEFPGLRRRRRSATREGERKSGADGPSRIELAVLRLDSEGRRVAFRVIVLAQRLEAEAVGGGHARDQFALSMSSRASADSPAMLHGDDARPLGAAHPAAEPVAPWCPPRPRRPPERRRLLVTAPGHVW